MAASSRKSQQEAEQPVKGWELLAVETQVKSLASKMTSEFSRVNKSLDALLLKAQTQVTPQQLSDNLIALKKDLDEKIDDEIKKVHLEYRPYKNTIKWLLITVAGAAITIFGQVVFILNITNGAN